MTITYLTPSSFCRWVEKSLADLDRVIDKHPGADIYCIHAIVHNPGITQTYRDRGVTFVETIDEITNPDAIVTFSAHGTNRTTLEQAKQRFQAIYNLECPLVTKIYKEIDMYIKKGIKTFLYIAKEGHQEAKNVKQYALDQGCQIYLFKTIEDIPQLPDWTAFSVLSQTTLNYDHVKSVIAAIQSRYPEAHLPPLTDICKATRERQTVILQNLDKFDALIVLWGKESHNTKELYNLGIAHNKRTVRWETMEELLSDHDLSEFLAHSRLAITWWASTPEADIRKMFKLFVSHGYEPKVANLIEYKGDYQ